MTLEQIIDILDVCSFTELTEDSFYDQIVNPIRQSGLLEEYGYKVSDFDYDSGASKCVLFFPDTDFVVKIPFEGSEYEDEYYDEEDQTYYGTGNWIFQEFAFADDGDAGSDYCLAEVRKYSLAEEYDEENGTSITDLFAKTEYVGMVHNYPVYTQPKCQPYSKDHLDSVSNGKSKHFLQIVDNSPYCPEPAYTTDGIGRISHHWIADMVCQYGEDYIEFLDDFLLGAHIEDLHYGNIGLLNDKPIILDYASFKD